MCVRERERERGGGGGGGGGRDEGVRVKNLTFICT